MKLLNSAFTLIELLVVIAIIGVLSSVVMIAINPAQRMAEARDAQRKMDIGQIYQALEAYSVRHGGIYPGEVCFDGSIGSDNLGCGACGTTPASCSYDGWHPNSQIYRGIVGEQHLKRLPKDPTNDTTYFYQYEPCCNQNCGGGKSCVGKGCCYFLIRGLLESTGTWHTMTSE